MLQTLSDEWSSEEEEHSDIDNDENDPNKLHSWQQTGIAMLDEAVLAAKNNEEQALAYEESMKLNVNDIGATGVVGVVIGGIHENLLTNSPSAVTHAQSQLLPSGPCH